MKAALGVLALVLNIVGYVPYIRDILKGIVRPQRITWGIWTILTSVTAVNQIANGGGFSSLFFVSTTLLVTTTFVLSIKHGVGGATRLDRACLLLAVVLFGYWALAIDTYASTFVAVIIDIVAFTPTLIKTYKMPQTETYPQWALAGIGGVLTLMAVPKLELVLIIYPLYIAIANLLIVTTKFVREK